VNVGCGQATCGVKLSVAAMSAVKMV